jgi:hypothetical protein
MHEAADVAHKLFHEQSQLHEICFVNGVDVCHIPQSRVTQEFRKPCLGELSASTFRRAADRDELQMEIVEVHAHRRRALAESQ